MTVRFYLHAPNFPVNATGNQINNIRQICQDNFFAFKKYVDVCNTISALIIEAIDPMYLATLRLPYVGIGTRTPLEFLAHLYTNYANIPPSHLKQNGLAMQQPCDVNQPIEVFFKQIEDAMEFVELSQDSLRVMSAKVANLQKWEIDPGCHHFPVGTIPPQKNSESVIVVGLRVFWKRELDGE